jgi:hypothetical protein
MEHQQTDRDQEGRQTEHRRHGAEVTKINHASDQSTYRYSSLQRMCRHQERPNIEARSCNHCCCKKAICIAYSKCVCVALVILHQSACAILYCHLWLLQHYHIFRRCLINGTIFGKNVIEHKICVLTLSTNFIWNISYFKKNSARFRHKCENVFM